MSISIFTITHVPFTPPENPIYIPLQVGASTHPDYGYLRDDTGDNISDKNKYYSELTGLYWIWKNNANADFLGLCHYRRFFLNEAGSLMNESEYMNILSNYDVMISQSRLGPYNYKAIYARSHDIHNLEETGNVIKELYPDYYGTFQAVLADNHCYVGNLFVAPKKLFCAYCEWLFSIFFALEKRIDVSGYDDYHMRVFGFLSEQLLIVWIKQNNLSYYETPFGLSQEKAETVALKKILRYDISQKDISGAYEHLCNTLKKRPDLLLGMSDFNQDLKMTEHILNICRIEQEANLPSLLSFSSDLDILLQHIRLIVRILDKIQNDDVEEKELQYLTDCRISHKAIIYILQNFKQFTENPLVLLNQLAVVYANAQNPLTALSYLDEALSIQETDKTTLYNTICVLQMLEQTELAAEYQHFLDHLSSLKRIVLFIGSGIPILDYIARQYAEALQALGHSVLLFDKQHFEQSMENLFLYQKEGLDAAIVFNNSCFQMRLQSGDSLWDTWKVPCYNILVDHPMYYFDTLDTAPAYGIVACADSYHTDYVKRFYPTVKNTLFLPTAGECIKNFKDLKPYNERSIDVLFIGSYKYHTDFIYDAFDYQLEKELLHHPYKTFEQAVEDCLAANQQFLSDGELKDFIQKHRFVDVNTTSIFRRNIMEILIQNDIPVTVYGNGWDTLEIFHHPNFHYQGLISPEDGIALMEDTKIVLNHMAWFKAGTSERIYEAILQGAIALTDSSEYLLEHLTNRKQIVYYPLNALNTLPEIIHTLLSDTALAEEIRIQAYQEVAAKHTWKQRAENLLDTLH